MRRLPRFLWLLAWSSWLWLGVGLYRELPRDPGPVVHRLWEGKGTTPLGFVGQSDHVAAQKSPLRGRSSSTIEVFDAAVGRRLTETTDEPNAFWASLQTSFPSALAEGVYLSTRGPQPTVVRPSGVLRALDLRTGRWTRLSVGGAGFFTVHPKRPVVAFFDDAENGSVVVANYHTGEKLFEYELPRRFLLSAPPVFLGDDRIALPLEALFDRPANGSWSFTIFKIGMPAKPLKTIHGPSIGRSVTSSPTGRIAFMNTQPAGLGVYDLGREAIVFRKPDPESTSLAPPGTPVIAANGRTVVIPKHGLLDVETGASLWKPGAFETIASWPNTDYFLVFEHWSALWTGLAPTGRFETLAYRSLETGELLWRNWNGSSVAPNFCNAARTLTVLSDGTVRRLPLRINWLLLAVCQTVLAVPLVLLWTILHWRAKRRNRLVAASP